ncbi:nitrate/nitrite transporter [Chloroflexota bacterium]
MMLPSPEPLKEDRGFSTVKATTGKYRFYALGLSTTNYGLIYGSAFCLPVVMLMVMEALNLSYSEVSLFLTMYNFAWCFGMIPAGWLADRFGIKTILTIGPLISGTCLFLWSLAPPYPVMCLLYTLMGLGAGLSWPAAVALVIKWFRHEEHGRALGIMNGGGHGILMVLYALATPVIAIYYGWQGPFRIFPILLFVWVAIFWFTVRLPSKAKTKSATVQENPVPKQPKVKSVFRNLGIWIIGVIGASYIVQYYVFFIFLPSYLQEVAGFSLTKAGLGAMIFLLACIPAGIVGGIVADRIGILKTQLIGCLISASAVIMAVWVIVDWALLVPVLFLIGWGSYFAFGPYLGLASRLVPPEQEASAIGLMSAIQWSPGIFVPVLAGWMLETTGLYTPMFYLATISPLIGVALYFIGKRYVKAAIIISH